MLACARSKILLLSFIKLCVGEKEKGGVRKSEPGREHALLLSEDPQRLEIYLSVGDMLSLPE